MIRLLRCLPFLFALAAVAPPAHTQAPPAAPPPGTAMSQEQLDALLAPIALYPDQLLAQVLMASTYPLDVVSAARFVKANPSLKGDALDKAVEKETWDPSVQSLSAFPQVLEMMNDKLQWTQQLGDAYLADQARVLTTVQSLRAKAQAAGNLKSNAEQKVVVQEKTIIIEPAKTEVVYVPAYNPTIVYGPWWAPAYPPFFWYPPPYYGYPPYVPGAAVVGGMIGFGIGLAVGANHWGWANTNWGGNNVNININQNNAFINNRPAYKNSVNNGNWQHSPEQRKGVAYRDAGTRDKFQKVDSNAAAARRDYRGHEAAGTRDAQRAGGGGDFQRPGGGSPGAISAQRPIERTGGGMGSASGGADRSASRSPSFDAGQSRSQAQSFSNRGATSRASMGAPRGGGGGGGGGRGGGRGR